jgi:Na+/proline symporter
MSLTNSTSNQSYSSKMTGKTFPTEWFLRGFTFAAIVPLLLAMLVWKSGNRHDFCIGLSVGLLIGLLAQSFSISNVEWNDTSRPSDVENFSITR